jgi:hypothetical protein
MVRKTLQQEKQYIEKNGMVKNGVMRKMVW